MSDFISRIFQIIDFNSGPNFHKMPNTNAGRRGVLKNLPTYPEALQVMKLVIAVHMDHDE